MLVHFDGRMEPPERYYDVHFNPESGVSDGEWVERLDAAMRESVQAHLVSDVPFGCFLSGGMDSTAVSGLMSETLNEPVRAFSIGFSEKEANEMPYARQVADRFNLKHIVQTVKPQALDILPDLVRHYGEPFGDQSAIPTYYVCQMARAHVPMVLSGDGGDESLAGYDSYAGWMRWMKCTPYQRPLWKRVLRPMLSALSPGRFQPDPQFKDPQVVKWLAQVTYCWKALRMELWQPGYHGAVQEIPDEFSRVFTESGDVLHPLHLAQYADYHTYLPNDILTKVDIASMMHGLEVRTPLIDRVFLETALRIPPEQSFRMLEDGVAFEGKLPLRGWLRRYFDPSFIERPKQGFSLPLAQWFDRESGALANDLNERLLSPGLALHEYLRPQAIERVLVDHNRVRNLAPQIWLLVFLSAWLEEQ